VALEIEEGFVLDKMIEDPEIVAVLSAHGARVAGVALDSEGRPVPGAVVVLMPEGREIVPAAVSECTTDQEGRFIFAGIAPGPYRLAAFMALQIGRGKHPEFLRQYFADSLEIDLAADENTNIDVTARSVPN
jgi:protocatechuate 3,4-dioxygenase beta subunit